MARKTWKAAREVRKVTRKGRKVARYFQKAARKVVACKISYATSFLLKSDIGKKGCHLCRTYFVRSDTS